MRHQIKTGGLSFQPRDNTANPFSSSCALHLRRVCGVCQFYDGPLRSDGQCRVLATRLPGRRDATDCEYWSRRMADGGGA